jgi:glycosyltransferase involved in cell wall biosynthesis
MAAGTPCIVSEAVGCAPDLIRPGITGEVFEVGDVAACAAALTRIRNAISHGHDFTEACQRTVADYSFQAATEGLLQAVASVQRPDG